MGFCVLASYQDDSSKTRGCRVARLEYKLYEIANKNRRKIRCIFYLANILCLIVGLWLLVVQRGTFTTEILVEN